MRNLIILMAMLLPILAVAQRRNCQQPAHTAKLKLQHGYEVQTIDSSQKPKEIPCDSMIIPVAIHVMGTTATRTCLESFVHQQIQALNDDFAGNNPDLTKFLKVQNLYPNTQAGKSCIRFMLANKNHPDGFGLQDGMPAITVNQLEDSTDWSLEWRNYFNLYIYKIGDNILGYSPLGGRGKGDGVAIAKFAWGGKGWCGDISQNNNFDKGRTLTHEVGHYFSLPHIWGHQTGCDQDDGFSDTPIADEPNWGCVGSENISCNSRDLAMNYMDYADDPCMYMFSAKQVDRMELYLQLYLPHLVENAFKVIKELEPEPEPIEEPIDSVPIDDPIDPIEDAEEDKPNWFMIFVYWLLAALGIATGAKYLKIFNCN